MQPFKFLSTPSARRATREPTPRTEAMQFLSTPSARRATKPETDIRIDKLISIHALCEEGDLTMMTTYQHRTQISIHALCEEGDGLVLLISAGRIYFYPRPLRGGRHWAAKWEVAFNIFLSTPSARRATVTGGNLVYFLVISIHALCEEGDENLQNIQQSLSDFYPRPLRGGRPVRPVKVSGGELISIHALCEEGDPTPGKAWRGISYFYPRPLRGGRPEGGDKHCLISLFLSTPSARRATAKTETKSLFSNKLYNILHEFRRALIYNGSKNYPNHAK